MATVDDLLIDLEAEFLDLRHLVGRLDDDGGEWDRPTPAEGWAVRDQISHLAYFDEAGTLALVDPARFAAEAEAALAQDGDPMEAHLERGRSMDGGALVAWWDSAHGQMMEALASADPADRIPWYGPPMGVLSFISARLMETWAHGHDVAEALGVTLEPTDRLRHIAHLGVRARPFSYAVRGLEVPPGRIEVVLTAPSGGEWNWQVGDALIGNGVTDPADASDRASDHARVGVGERPASVVGSALDFCLVVTQRRHVADTALAVHGAESTEWMSIAQAFAGAPGPGRPAQGDSAEPSLGASGSPSMQ